MKAKPGIATMKYAVLLIEFPRKLIKCCFLTVTQSETVHPSQPTPFL